MRAYVWGGLAIAVLAALAVTRYEREPRPPRVTVVRDELGSTTAAERAEPARDARGVTNAAVRQAFVDELVRAQRATTALPAADPLSEARSTLDGRLTVSPGDPAETARMRQALESLIRTKLLDQ